MVRFSCLSVIFRRGENLCQITSPKNTTDFWLEQCQRCLLPVLQKNRLIQVAFHVYDINSASLSLSISLSIYVYVYTYINFLHKYLLSHKLERSPVKGFHWFGARNAPSVCHFLPLACLRWGIRWGTRLRSWAEPGLEQKLKDPGRWIGCDLVL